MLRVEQSIPSIACKDLALLTCVWSWVLFSFRAVFLPPRLQMWARCFPRFRQSSFPVDLLFGSFWISLDLLALGICWENSWENLFDNSNSGHMFLCSCCLLWPSLAHFPCGGAADRKTNRFESRVNDVFKDRPTKGSGFSVSACLSCFFHVTRKGNLIQESDSEVVVSCLTRFGRSETYSIVSLADC